MVRSGVRGGAVENGQLTTDNERGAWSCEREARNFGLRSANCGLFEKGGERGGEDVNGDK
jgi:hypothetical protein